MTTQYTHDEQSGAEFTAAEQPYTLAFVADSTPAEVSPPAPSATPEEQSVSAENGSSAHQTEAKQAIEGTHETHATSIAPSAETSAPTSAATEEVQPVFMPEGNEQPQESPSATAAQETQEISGPADGSAETPTSVQAAQTMPDTASQSDTPATETVTSASTSDEPANEQTSEQLAGTIDTRTAATAEATSEASSSVQPQPATLPPFTAFIEEFRQAEARLNVSRQDSVSESFESFALFQLTGETSLSSTPSEQTIEEAPGSGQSTLSEQSTGLAQQVEAEASEQTEQPVTPSTRFRFLRSATTQAEEHGASAAEQPATQAGEESTTPSKQEPRRPARRYRFDRPATTNGSGATAAPITAAAASSPVRGEEPKEAKEATGKQSSTSNSNEQNEQNGQNGHNGSNNHSNTAGTEKAGTQATVQTTPVAQEASSAESSTPAPVSSEPERRRRHGQERREKEQATSAASPASINPSPVSPAQPAQETIAPVTEQTSPMIEEIAPEDLPPLEYADLQKSNGRRRRRHRPGTPATPEASSNGTLPTPLPLAEPTTPAAGTPPTAPLNPIPAANKSNGQTPATPATPTPYSIVSGYTVNQMNQGNENAGPFMGPEPSPARGSVLTREGRTLRAETQRLPIYPTRGGGHESTSASSIHQLASMLSQAIQTQTDRMVAELRRANQAPTNVSVSIPPFPSTERVGVFVDVANLLYSARTMRISIDFGKLLDFLRGNRRLIRAHAYCPTSPQAGDEQMFLQAVKGLGYRITTKNYKTFASGAKKADLDLDLCMDIVRLVDGRAVDCIVLVSGDSDFMPVLDYCSDHGVRVEVAAFDEAMSATLRQSCDLFINLSMLQEIRS